MTLILVTQFSKLKKIKMKTLLSKGNSTTQRRLRFSIKMINLIKTNISLFKASSHLKIYLELINIINSKRERNG